MKKVLPSRQLPLISHPVTDADVGHFMEPRANILVFYATAAHCSTACLQHNAGTPYLHMSRHPCHCDCFSQGQEVALAAGDEFGFEGPHCPQDTLQTPLHANILSANGHHSCPLPRAAVRTLVFL